MDEKPYPKAASRFVSSTQDLSAQQTITTPKSYRECGIEEKLDRLYHEFMKYRHTVEFLRRTGIQLRNHKHDQNGYIVVPLGSGTISNEEGESGRFDFLK